MSRLCLGTYLTAIKHCAVKNGFTQKIVFKDMFESIDREYAPNEDMIGHLVRGAKNPSMDFINTINDIDPVNFSKIADCMNSVASKIDPNKIDLFTKILKKILDGDDSISNDTVVDLVNGTTKSEFPGKYDSLASLLAGVFIYVIKNTDNKNQTNNVKEIDSNFIAELLVEYQHKTKENNITAALSEDEEIKARRFILTYEKAKSLIPLCQIVFAYNPSHNYKRTMFTEYNLLTKEIRKQILDLCKASNMIDIDKLYWEEGLSLFLDDLRKYDLSSERYINMFNNYFPINLRYASCGISKFEKISFKRILMSEIISPFPNAACCNMDGYVDDYLYIIENNKNIDAPKPMDYLCEIKNLRSCPEEDLIYWLCRFIIVACNNLSCRITGKRMYVDCYDRDAETIEDLFFSAIYALHRHYHFHNNDCMGMDIDI